MSDRTLSDRTGRTTSVFRWLAALAFIVGGTLHLVVPAPYMRIVPPGFGPPALVVLVSGIAEIAGGVGLLIGSLRRAAGIGLIVLLLAVFPANLYMARHAEQFTGAHLRPWMLWARLPLQAVFIAWIWLVTRPASK